MMLKHFRKNMDYKLLDTGNKRRLEKFGNYIVDRPDPEVMWSKGLSEEEWKKADAVFDGIWRIKNKFPKNWQINYGDLKLNLKLTPFKHTGIFPEQQFEWEIMKKHITNSKSQPNILSLFGYTGVASLVALSSGAKVTHVDGSKPAITWFRENQTTSNLIDKPCRLILDDCQKFVEREVKRGNKYDGIVMDPPVYGHGPNGEVWNFTKDFPKLLDNVTKILTDNPLFLIINAYAVSTSPVTIENMLREKLAKFKGLISSGELFLEEESLNRKLTTGIWVAWQK
ncbi:MAG: class I SAM-dependent methyltransferase [bacterium]|nr:MAG: class I SAM-dependent methyltransferase [bacterium]